MVETDGRQPIHGRVVFVNKEPISYHQPPLARFVERGTLELCLKPLQDGVDISRPRIRTSHRASSSRRPPPRPAPPETLNPQS